MVRFWLIGIAFVVVFTVVVFVMAATTPGLQMRSLPKWLWLIICVIPLIGGLLFLFAGRPNGKSVGLVAPDDDLDYLQKLADKLAKKNDSGKKPTSEPDEPSKPAS